MKRMHLTATMIFFPAPHFIVVLQGHFGLKIPFFDFSDDTYTSVHPEIGQLGRDQGFRKILPEAYG
jgi:hypothetical protein